MTNITVDQTKQNSASEIQEITSSFERLFDMKGLLLLSSKYLDYGNLEKSLEALNKVSN